MLDTNIIQHLGPHFTTYTSGRHNTTPDLILCNNKTYHNHIIEEGPTTTSDHTPILFTITASAIKTKTQPQYNLKKADWDSFSKNIENNIIQANPPELATVTQIDQSLNKWISTITQ